jgi:hypothetical protein
MLKKYLFELTPLRKADKEVRDYLKEGLEPHQFERYQSALNHYRHTKVIQSGLKILFYASVIASVATTIGLDEAQILQRIASYIGTSLIFVLYGITSYISMIRRETYHVQREILISKAEWE